MFKYFSVCFFAYMIYMHNILLHIPYMMYPCIIKKAKTQKVFQYTTDIILSYNIFNTGNLETKLDNIKPNTSIYHNT